jgi:8-oxo-dGTP diphosphatase
MLVVAGLIYHEGLYLVGQRKKNDKHGLKWEFPGGKVEHGEEPRQALVRELREELAIEALLGEEAIRYEYTYGGRPPLTLIFYRVSSYSGVPQSREFEQIRWVEAGAMPGMDFLDGDADFVRKLARGEI